jgi:large subunit ribosomal protein L22
MEVRAVAKQVKVSPYKVRRILDLIRGKNVKEALTVLQFLPTPNAKIVANVVKSAAANAENNFSMSKDDLRIIETFADEGRVMKRFRPKARGRISPILKRSSHITVVVDEREE